MARTNARQVILELIRDAKGTWDGKTKLFKAFYFAHLYYAKNQPGILTDWPIARLPQGPGIHNSSSLIGGLVQDGYLTVEEIQEGPYPEYRYRLTEKAQEAPPLPDDAKAAVASAAGFTIPMLATQLSQLTHDRSRSWREAKNGDIIDIYVDLLPDDEFEKDREQIGQLEQLLTAALKDN